MFQTLFSCMPTRINPFVFLGLCDQTSQHCVWQGQDIWDFLETPKKKTTPLKINGWKPKNPPIEKEHHLPRVHCWVQNMNFPGRIPPSCVNQRFLCHLWGILSSPCNEWRGYTLQPKDKKLLGFGDLFHSKINGQMDGVCLDVCFLNINYFL